MFGEGGKPCTGLPFTKDHQSDRAPRTHLRKGMKQCRKVFRSSQASDAEHYRRLAGPEPGMVEGNSRLLLKLRRHDRVRDNNDPLTRDPDDTRQIVRDTLRIGDEPIGPWIQQPGQYR